MIPALSDSAAREIVEAYLDHERWCRECLSILDKRGVRVDLGLSPSQQAFSDACRRQEAETGGMVRQWCVKGRQIHLSVGVTSELFKRTVFVPGRITIVMAQLESSLMSLRNYWAQFLKTYRPWGAGGEFIKLPTITRDADKHIKFANESEVHFFTAGSESIGRGWRVTGFHGSEFPFWPAPMRSLNAIMSAMPYLPGTFAAIESTAYGQGDPFHQGYLRAKQRREFDGNHWWPFFFSSFEHPENRILLPLAEQQRLRETLEHWEQDLINKYGLSLDQVAWMRGKIETDCQGSLSMFCQEHPWSAEVAFRASGRPRFDSVALDRHPESEPCLVGDIHVDDTGPRPRQIFVPRKDGLGAVRVYQRPVAGRRYVFGADPAKGVDINKGAGVADPDWAVAIVLDGESGEQVAVYRDRVAPSVFAEHVINLARWYGRDVYGCPEANELGFLEALIRGYDTALLSRRDAMPDQRTHKTLHEIGWLETSRSRPLLISQLDDAIRTMSVVVRDAVTLSELRSFVYNPTGKAEHADGCHDDCVFALALAYEALLKQPRVLSPISRTGKAITPVRPARPAGEYDWLKGAM